MIEQSETADPPLTEPVSVLLIDDDETWVRTQRRLLERYADVLDVSTATSYAKAQKRLQSTAPDCIVCDYQLGDGTGIELLASVREQTPTLPFILVTGEGDEGVASDAISHSVTDYVRKIDLGSQPTQLAQRIKTLVSATRTQLALNRERRSKETLLQLVTSGSTRTEVGHQLCTQLVDERGYGCAWVGILDEQQGVVPLSSAGTTAYIEAAIKPGTRPLESTEPTFTALSENKSIVRSLTESLSPTDSNPTSTPDSSTEDTQWIDHAHTHGFETIVAVPIRYNELTFGVLSVYSRAVTRIDDHERELLEEYAETLGYVFHTTAWKRTLRSSALTTVRFRFTDDRLPLVDLSSRLQAETTIRTRTVIPRTDSTVFYLATIKDATSDDLFDAVDETEAIHSVDVYRTDGEIRCGLVVDSPVPEQWILDNETQYVQTVAKNGHTDLIAVLGDQTTVQQCVDGLTTVTGSTPVATLCTDQNPSQAADTTPVDRLTDRQQQVLQLAISAGYFERPRHNNTGELAETLNITRATFTQHLRAAQRKVFEQYTELR